MAESFEQKIIGLFGLGMSFRDISAHIKEMYNIDISAATLSSITNKVIPIVTERQSRPLESLYCIIWMDGMYYKVKQDYKMVALCVYNILGVTTEGKRDVLWCYVNEAEGANFWLSVLTDIQNRGVIDIIIAGTDNLKGIKEAISTVFAQTDVQSCLVHQIRNSLKYEATKDQKEFMQNVKLVYQAVNIKAAEMELEKLAEKWSKKYPVVIESW